MTLLEDKLSEKGVKQVKGLPLEILYTLVTDNGISPDFSAALTEQGIRVLAV